MGLGFGARGSSQSTQENGYAGMTCTTPLLSVVRCSPAETTRPLTGASRQVAFGRLIERFCSYLSRLGLPSH